jgi:AcrR family transcriptional regulator
VSAEIAAGLRRWSLLPARKRADRPMSVVAATHRRRLWREERRPQILAAAAVEFGRRGPGASTQAIADRAGISQAYLFRFYCSTTELLAAAVRVALSDPRKRARRTAERHNPTASPREATPERAALLPAGIAALSHPELGPIVANELEMFAARVAHRLRDWRQAARRLEIVLEASMLAALVAGSRTA